MSRSIEAGDFVQLHFDAPPPDILKTLMIRNIQEKSGHINIFLKEDANKSGILTLKSSDMECSETGILTLKSSDMEYSDMEYSGTYRLLKVIFINKDEMPSDAMKTEQEYIKEYTEAGEFNEEDVRLAADRGFLNLLHHFAMTDFETFSESPVADSAAASGHVNILIWLESFDPPISVGESTPVFGYVIEGGHLNVLQYWIDQDGAEKYFHQDVILRTVTSNNYSLDMFKWAVQTFPVEFEDHKVELANTAAEYGHMDAIQYLESLDPPVRPDSGGVDMALKNNHLYIVDYLELEDLTKIRK